MKQVQLFLVTIALLSSFGAVAKDNTANAGDGTPKTKQEIEAALTNYRISYVVKNAGQPDSHRFEAHCAEGWASMNPFYEGKIMVVNKAGGKVYLLDTVKKTGEWGPYTTDAAYPGIGLGYLFSHISPFAGYESNFESLKKTGKTETIAGRKATVYTRTFMNGEDTLWIDNEYGCTLKYTQVREKSADFYIYMEVTEFKAGGVTMSDIVNLSEYKLTKAKKK